ncbi:hypothetical protein MNBD_BACTEROID01-737 [hydrothermal vent metagenome]|uniref:Uncharacterized protein n=1 Tax=hydrothermal vent metagenome TaxID=652676 RepID=A0A3B0TVH4_9ZZZZ
MGLIIQRGEGTGLQNLWQPSAKRVATGNSRIETPVVGYGNMGCRGRLLTGNSNQGK